MPLSIVPSQSLSLPSQTSGDGGTSLAQSSTPELHTRAPCMHSPLVIPQAWPTWGRLPSSAVPLQSLSMPSQVSPAGPLGFWQTQPEAPAQASEPLLQGGASVPLSLQLPPGGGHQVRFLNVQQLPGRVQQPF